MAALLVDVFLLEEYALVEVGVEVGLHLRGLQVGGPSYEVVDALLRTVGIVDFQAVALLHHVVAHCPECLGGLPCEQGRGLLVAVDALSHEIVGAVVANLQDGIGHGVGQGDELAVVLRRADHHGVGISADATGNHAHTADGSDDETYQQQ